MANYNLLSGSAIDNYLSFLFDVIDSEKCFLGYARKAPIWGLDSLVFIEHQTTWTQKIGSPNFEYLDGTDNFLTNKFFDKNSQTLIGGSLSDFYREIYIAYTDDLEDYDLTAFSIISNDLIAGGDGRLYLDYVNEFWAKIQNLSPYYYKEIFLDIENHPTRKYYILNYAQDTTIPIKIVKKTKIELPYYATDCRLYYTVDGSQDKNYININLKKTINILGEILITGLIDPDSPNYDLETGTNYFLKNLDSSQKSLFLNAGTNFFVEDFNGNTLIYNMKYIAPIPDVNSPILFESNSEKYVLYSYFSPYTNETLYVKVRVGTYSDDEIGIWNESLPFKSSVPVDDSNPPGLDVTYLKNPVVKKSISDVLGLIKIKKEDILFIKELKTLADKETYENYGFEIEEMELIGETSSHLGYIKENVSIGSTLVKLRDGHSFIEGDDIILGGSFFKVMESVFLPGNSYVVLDYPLNINLLLGQVIYSEQTNINAKVVFAKTIDKDKALKYNFDSILINKQVDNIGEFSPTEDIYRQIFICYKPKNIDGTECSLDVYSGIFQPQIHDYDIGLLLYLANKVPVYRKWITNKETFKIIL